VQPYLDAAIRSGLVSGWQQESFNMSEPITGAETAVALQNALDLPAGHEEMAYGEEVPAWAATSLAVMAQNGVELEAFEAMTRGEIANILYQTSRMAVGAPGMMVFNMQE
jgi:long-subunit acyl-CoA synthetase (AMP-forming)